MRRSRREAAKTGFTQLGFHPIPAHPQEGTTFGRTRVEMDPQNWTTSRRAGVHESKGPHVKNCSKPISSVVSVSWIINCPFLTSVIHAQNRRCNELSHLGTLVRSPKLENEHHLWQTGFPIQLHLAHLSSLSSPGPQPKPCAPISASSSLVPGACLCLLGFDSHNQTTYIFARAWPATGCCLFSLKQTVWLL